MQPQGQGVMAPQGFGPQSAGMQPGMQPGVQYMPMMLTQEQLMSMQQGGLNPIPVPQGAAGAGPPMQAIPMQHPHQQGKGGGYFNGNGMQPGLMMGPGWGKQPQGKDGYFGGKGKGGNDHGKGQQPNDNDDKLDDWLAIRMGKSDAKPNSSSAPAQASQGGSSHRKSDMPPRQNQHAPRQQQHQMPQQMQMQMPQQFMQQQMWTQQMPQQTQNPAQPMQQQTPPNQWQQANQFFQQVPPPQQQSQWQQSWESQWHGQANHGMQPQANSSSKGKGDSGKGGTDFGSRGKDWVDSPRTAEWKRATMQEAPNADIDVDEWANRRARALQESGPAKRVPTKPAFAAAPMIEVEAPPQSAVNWEGFQKFFADARPWADIGVEEDKDDPGFLNYVKEKEEEAEKQQQQNKSLDAINEDDEEDEDDPAPVEATKEDMRTEEKICESASTPSQVDNGDNIDNMAGSEANTGIETNDAAPESQDEQENSGAEVSATGSSAEAKGGASEPGTATSRSSQAPVSWAAKAAAAAAPKAKAASNAPSKATDKSAGAKAAPAPAAPSAPAASPPATATVAEPAAATEATAAPASGQAAANEKRKRALQKKLRQIEDLEERKKGGATLDAEQEAKVASRAALEEEIEQLG